MTVKEFGTEVREEKFDFVTCVEAFWSNSS